MNATIAKLRSDGIGAETAEGVIGERGGLRMAVGLPLNAPFRLVQFSACYGGAYLRSGIYWLLSCFGRSSEASAMSAFMLQPSALLSTRLQGLLN